METNTR